MHAAAFNGSASEERIIKIDYWRQVGVKEGAIHKRRQNITSKGGGISNFDVARY